MNFSFLKRYKNYLKLAPLAILLFWLPFVLVHRGGGRVTSASGINAQLPPPIDGRALLGKKLQYEAAERDSLRKAQFERQDPYRRDSGALSGMPGSYAARPAGTAIAPLRPLVRTDPRASEVLEQLRRLRQVVASPSSSAAWDVRPVRPRLADVPPDTVGDARVGQLNSMLDRVIRIQHPEEVRQKTVSITDEVLPADSGANTIAAVVASDQTLISGTTLALRLLDSIRVNGILWPAGQLVYGTVTISNDRMLVHVSSLRSDRSLFVTDLQVFDLDGIAGIHIPGVLGRDVVKESAGQGVSSLNVLEADPSLGAQAANAGIQTMKTFVGRKVRQVRVNVRAGYQVLLREARPKMSRTGRPAAVVVGLGSPPGFVPDGPVIAHCRAEGVRLRLRGLWLLDGRLWFGLEWENRSAIAYSAAYARWYIRDRRQVRRTAMQELPVEPLGGASPCAVAADSVVHSWTGFEPFALAREKELVLEVAEKGGGRVLELVIKHQELLNAKTYVRETGAATQASGTRAL